MYSYVQNPVIDSLPYARDVSRLGTETSLCSPGAYITRCEDRKYRSIQAKNIQTMVNTVTEIRRLHNRY